MVDHISSDDFARTFGQRTGQLAWLLGAGTSASAGVPTGQDMINDFKVRLFSSDVGLPRQEVDISDPIWDQQVNSHFDGACGFPPLGAPDEYAAAFEAAFPSASDRRSYIDDAVKRGSPSYGHRVLASLISNGFVRCLFTTNFDQLVERATVITDEMLPVDQQVHLTVSALDSVDRGERCMSEDDWPVLVKLHGDYQSEHLKNTAEELQVQDERLRTVFVQALSRFGLVVVGYSGRDDSVMDALDEVVAIQGAMPAGLWWVSRQGEQLLPRVQEMLQQAEESGIEVHIVDSENFDELAGDLEGEVSLEAPLLEHIREVRPRPVVEPVTLPTKRYATFPAVRCSALEVLELPCEAREIAVNRPLTAVEARKLVKDARVWATVASRGRTLVAFGADRDLEQAFASVGGELRGRVPINPAQDSIDRGLVYEALTRAIARHRPLRPVLRGRGHAVVVQPASDRYPDHVVRRHEEQLDALRRAYGTALTGSVPSIQQPFAEAAQVRLEYWNGTWWLVYEPFTWVDLPRADEGEAAIDELSRSLTSAPGGSSSKFVAADWRRERWAQRYNPKWNKIIAAWAKLMAPASETELLTHYFESEGICGGFRLSWTTAWSSPVRASPWSGA
ncbi:MAG: SIR2 family protein [Gemmatimonadetes bacterium]|nr:SIR2 family protein [Acidimicrobiia bacterium]MYE73390.1 SIR2 family protein [Acidimicrobiia bacterium]MYJ12442.1 SIR2 family protein [Gemmatimonadota bacterium]